MSYDHLPQRELELLSAYMDGELSPRQARRVEARLQSDPRWRSELQALRSLTQGMRALPQVRPPRSFLISPEMVGASRRVSSYPILRLATALAAFAFIVLAGLDVFSSSFSGALPARSLDQVMAEAPAAAELQLADAAKSEVQELDAAIEPGPADLMAAAEAPAEEAAAEGLELAEPAVEGEGAVEERAVGESDAVVETQVVELEPELPAEDEAALAFSATAVPEAEAMANQIEATEPSSEEISALAERGPIASLAWIRWLEAGLAIVTILLGALTLRARKLHR